MINLMPMLTFSCRIKLSLAIIQQRTQLGGAPTLRLQVQPMNLTLISHHAFQLMFFIIFNLKKNKKTYIFHFMIKTLIELDSLYDKDFL